MRCRFAREAEAPQAIVSRKSGVQLMSRAAQDNSRSTKPKVTGSNPVGRAAFEAASVGPPTPTADLAPGRFALARPTRGHALGQSVRRQRHP